MKPRRTLIAAGSPTWFGAVLYRELLDITQNIFTSLPNRILVETNVQKWV